ncbi:MAG: biotin/lipoyl-binding protein [Anaerolineae bacterium]|nr:biotin/lipoyl-binding protein [Anaerolineae bacterium]
MPTFDVTIQGKKYHVEIPDPGASPLQVVVDGQTFDVEVAGTGLTVHPAPRPEAPPPAPEPPALPPMPRLQVARPVAPAGANGMAGGGHDVVSPMPGTILSVDVKPGAFVEVGQVVCVLEAMKMKNPIRASFAGTVAEVNVNAGQNVAYGDVLVRLA